MRQASLKIGVHYQTCRKWEVNSGIPGVREKGEKHPARVVIGPKTEAKLCKEARRALDDFEYFRLRYMGHISTPWQIETGNLIVKLLATQEKEFVVENCPPGAGKTTLCHDIAAWVTVKDRRVRGLFGSRVENNARRQLRRLRRTLERTTPEKAKDRDKQKGIAVDAEATLSGDYGMFKPVSREIWKADEFVVAQLDGEEIAEKEPTWSSYGMDSGVLGNRFDLIFWDDVVDKRTIRTLEAQMEQREWWDDEAETRLEPAGVALLVGQRMNSNDLYRYCLDKKLEGDEEDDGNPFHHDQETPIEAPRQYRHIVYKAHYDELCTGKHKRDADPWPDGCLLDPYRIPWKELRGIMANPNRFRVLYQQEDADPEKVLVKPVWIWGGTDPEDGSLCPGCVDEDRNLCELPKHLMPPLVSTATVDPSPTKMWAAQWWVHAPQNNLTYLMDLERKSMPANELLDWNHTAGTFYGLMEEWQSRSVELGYPISTWIVEINAAQRFLLAYDHVRRWQQKWGVSIIPHSTGPRKLDPEYGPWIVRDHFRHGRIRLPMSPWGKARYTSLKLIDEVTRWPNATTTDDEVMACWFEFAHLPQLTPRNGQTPRAWRPSWLAAG